MDYKCHILVVISIFATSDRVPTRFKTVRRLLQPASRSWMQERQLTQIICRCQRHLQRTCPKFLRFVYPCLVARRVACEDLNQSLKAQTPRLASASYDSVTFPGPP